MSIDVVDERHIQILSWKDSPVRRFHPEKTVIIMLKNLRIFSSLSNIEDLQLQFDIKANKLVTTS